MQFIMRAGLGPRRSRNVETPDSHSVDATLVIPPQRTFPEVIRNTRKSPPGLLIR